MGPYLAVARWKHDIEFEIHRRRQKNGRQRQWQVWYQGASIEGRRACRVPGVQMLQREYVRREHVLGAHSGKAAPEEVGRRGVLWSPTKRSGTFPGPFWHSQVRLIVRGDVDGSDVDRSAAKK